MDMQRYLLVPGKDLLTVDEELSLEPINNLVARQEQEPCEIVVLSLADNGSASCGPISFVFFTGIASAPVILATGRQAGTWLARVLRGDPTHRLRRRWG